MKHKLIITLCIVFCCLPLAFGIFHKGFFVSDDGNWMVIRLSAFYEALSSGQFPVRMLPRLNQGLGYPVADFLYPLFLYVGSFIHLFKVPFLLDIKILFFSGMLVSFGGMYLFLKRNFTTLPSLLGGAVYTYFPYHLYDLYTRGSLGEIVALALLPFVMWAIEKKSMVLVSIFLGLLILSHNTLALFFLPFVIIYAYIIKIPIKQILVFTILGLSLSLFFSLPALFDKQYTIFDAVAVANPFVYFVNTVSYGLVGWISIVIFAGVLLLKSTYKNAQALFFLSFGLIALFFSFSVSSVFWHIHALTAFVQFPFRFLSLTLFAESFLSAYLFEKIKKPTIVILLLVLLIVSSWMYLFPKAYAYLDETFYTTNVSTTTVMNEYMPYWVQQLPTTYAYQRITPLKGKGQISVISQKGTKLTFTTTSPSSMILLVHFVYFPGWQATIDGKTTSLTPSRSTGLLQLLVPKGAHTIVVWFAETPVRLFADILTVVSLLVVITLYVKKYYEK